MKCAKRLKKLNRRSLNSCISPIRRISGAWTLTEDKQMFDSLKKLFNKDIKPSQNDQPGKTPYYSVIPSSMDEAETYLKSLFHDSSDIVIRPIQTFKDKAIILYVDGLSSKDLIGRDIIAPLKAPTFDGDVIRSTNISQYTKVTKVAELISGVLSGNTGVLYEGAKEALVADLKKWEMRGVEMPDSEGVIRGPKEGFTESIRINTSMLRRKIRTPDLVIENIVIGEQTNTKIGIAYINGIVNSKVLEILKERLSKINTDAILESGYIEQYIEERVASPLATVAITQRPDIAAAKILEGRVAILCDGTPHVLTVPHLFIENLQSSEDYYNRFIFGTLQRMIRLFALFVCILLPGLYVAITTFNQELIPTVFLLTLLSSNERVPLPAGAEAFFMLLMFELLRESGTRLPRQIGSAISIVGALIIGQAAVDAGIVSNPMVIVTALTAVATLAIPSLTEFALIYRFFFLFLGAFMGIPGICSGFIIMMVQIASLDSFGVPVLAAWSEKLHKDQIIRFPLIKMIYRPLEIARGNIRRHRSP